MVGSISRVLEGWVLQKRQVRGIGFFDSLHFTVGEGEGGRRASAFRWIAVG